MRDIQAISDRKKCLAKDSRDDYGRLYTKIRFTDDLYFKIKEEAKQHNWPFARMVRHLCEASIDGIE